MDWLVDVVKTGGPVFALAALTLWLGYKFMAQLITPIIENNRKLTEAVATMAAKLEYGGRDDG